MAAAKKAAADSTPAATSKGKSAGTTAVSGGTKTVKAAAKTAEPSAATATPATKSPAKVTENVNKPATPKGSKDEPDTKKPVKTEKPVKAEKPTQMKAVKGPGGTMIMPSKDFDLKFLESQQLSLIEERRKLTGQALRLETEANALIEDAEMGDVQFDEEGGEGDTMVVERERDLAISAQNHQTVAEIDAAMERMAIGTYGYSVQSGLPIPKERLEFLPWASLRVDEKVGGIGRR